MKFPRFSNSSHTSFIMSLRLYFKSFFIGSMNSFLEFSITFTSYGSLLNREPLNEPVRSTDVLFGLVIEFLCDFSYELLYKPLNFKRNEFIFSIFFLSNFLI
jgi:hypothetical protein